MKEESIDRLHDVLRRIYHKLRLAGKKADKITAGLHPQQKRSAHNLLHYLALRNDDLRDLQDELHNAGLSSLASSESHVMRQVQAVLQRLGEPIPRKDISPVDYPTAGRLLRQRANALFGAKLHPNIPHLMVTFDGKLADDYSGVKKLLQAGMNIARINCAHDNPEAWRKMIGHVQKASRATGLPCKIYLDLAGPKIRTELLGKGRKKGRMKLLEQERFFLAEAGADFNKDEKVVGCTLPGVVKDLRPGDRVLFDDGLFEAVVETGGELLAVLRVTRISAAKPRLKPEKGINFPDTELSVRCLTDYDKSVLPFAQAHADILGFSFVRSAADVAELQGLLRRDSGKTLPIVLKIETYEAVQNLPSLLLQGMTEPAFGVMIARGDLAVEIGFERLSEIQDEILWLCEAAHVPVIWATQVLETLNKSGIATRSEVTDAAHAAHAECVMLNKGRYLLTVLATLQDILHRSGGHHVKKRYIFRTLKIAERFWGGV
jgi:pyruvate kinase